MEYDICLSFAGEDRPYVDAVADALRMRGVRVFYDRYEKVQLWGKDLYQHLDDIYRNRARYCLIFASSAYASKVWTRHELSSAQARAIKGNEDYILPARFDDTEIPGILPTTGYIDLRHETPEQVAELIVSKLAFSPAPESVTLAPTPRDQPLSSHDRGLVQSARPSVRHVDAPTRARKKSNVITALQKSVPEILYHYTAGASLLSIFATRRMWATDTRYLADRTEFDRAENIIRYAAADLSGDTPKSRQFATAVYEAALATKIFVAAFSESGDMLSQWQSYAGRSGFALGFDARALRQLPASHLVRVQYDAAAQLDLVGLVIKKYMSKIARLLDGKDVSQHGHVVDRIAMDLAVIAAASKAPAFSDEREWRLLAFSSASTRRRFRDTATGPVPYLELPLTARSQDHLPLRSVTHAPSATPGLTRNGLLEVLSEHGYTKTVAISSTIPHHNAGA